METTNLEAFAFEWTQVGIGLDSPMIFKPKSKNTSENAFLCFTDGVVFIVNEYDGTLERASKYLADRLRVEYQIYKREEKLRRICNEC